MASPIHNASGDYASAALTSELSACKRRERRSILKGPSIGQKSHLFRSPRMDHRAQVTMWNVLPFSDDRKWPDKTSATVRATSDGRSRGAMRTFHRHR